MAAGDAQRHRFPGRNATMAKTESKTASAAVKDILLSDPDGCTT